MLLCCYVSCCLGCWICEVPVRADEIDVYARARWVCVSRCYLNYCWVYSIVVLSCASAFCFRVSWCYLGLQKYRVMVTSAERRRCSLHHLLQISNMLIEEILVRANEIDVYSRALCFVPCGATQNLEYTLGRWETFCNMYGD